jgi:WD40 repeat protein
MTDGTERWHMQHDALIRGLAVSPDNTCVATASEDGTVLVLASDSGTVRRRVSHASGATSATFTADGNAVISGSLDGAVLISSLTDPATPPASLAQFPVPVTHLIASDTSSSVAVATDDQTVRILDLDLRVELARYRYDAAVNDIAADPANGLLATGTADGILRIYPWPPP